MSTIPDGDDILEFISRLGAPVGAWVAAVGSVSEAELTLTGKDGAVTPAGFGPATLVSLLGPVAGPLMAVLSINDGGLVVAGRLTRAAAAKVTVSLLATPPAPVAPARPAFQASTLGAATAAAAKRVSAAAAEDEADELPEPGDRLDHFVFGVCDVMVVTGERIKIRELAGGKLRDINVGPFRISKPVVQDGKRVFKLVKRG